MLSNKYLLLLSLFLIGSTMAECNKKNKAEENRKPKKIVPAQNFSAAEDNSHTTAKKQQKAKRTGKTKLTAKPVQEETPFVLATGSYTIRTNNKASFQDLGLNTLIAWNTKVLAFARYAKRHNLHWIVYEFGNNLNAELMEKFSQIPAGIGFMINDEPSRQEMKKVAAAIQRLRKKYSQFLYLSNALPGYASTKQLWGNTHNPNYTYTEYLKDYIQIIEPDIMMYDHYPFLKRNRIRKFYFSDLMAVRAVAQAARLPYWGWIQSFQQYGWRIPSESDLRMHAFTMLTVGYTGLSHFFYNPSRTRKALIKINKRGQAIPTSIYRRAKK